MPPPEGAQARVVIDWFAPTDLVGPSGQDAPLYEDVSAYVLANPAITLEYGRDTARSTAPPMIGVAEGRLLNVDRHFSPENPTTPLYQKIRPGRPISVELLHGTRTTWRSHTQWRSHTPWRGRAAYALLTGHLESFGHTLEFGNEQVSWSAAGSASRLRRKTVTVPYMSQCRTDEAVTQVLNMAGWPAEARDIRTGDATLEGYWADERTAWDCLVELTATEGAGAVFWESGDGVIHWLNRNHRATDTRATISQATLHDGTAGSGYLYSSLTYDPQWQDLITRVTVETNQRTMAGTPEVVWQLGDDLVVSVGSPQTITAEPDTPFLNAIYPVNGTDFTVSGGTAAVYLGFANGSVAILVVEALIGTPTISGLQLRAQPLNIIGETTVEQSVEPELDEDAHTVAIAAWPELQVAHAQAIALSYLNRYKTSRPIITIVLENLDGTTMEQILKFRISDRVTIVNRHLGVNADAWIEKLRHEVVGDGRHAVTLWCEPVFAIASTGAVWDSALWDTGVWGI